MKKFLVLMLMVGLVAGLSGCSSKVNKENYDKIKMGMTQAEVESILGEPTEQVSSSMDAPGMPSPPMPGMEPGGGQEGMDGKTMIWKEGDKVITVIFLNGKVKAKSHTGL
jgi:uncharacterized protein YceK